MNISSSSTCCLTFLNKYFLLTSVKGAIGMVFKVIFILKLEFFRSLKHYSTPPDSLEAYTFPM